MSKCDAVLRFNQVLLYVVTLASGLATCLGSGWVSRILTGKCVLYSDMTFAEGLNGSISLLTVDSKWGPEWRCDFCTFTTATAAIYAIIWFWFYVLLSEHKYSVMEDRLKLAGLLNFRQAKDEAPPDFKLFMPSLVLNIVLFVCVCMSAAFLNGGIDSWCQNYFRSTRYEPPSIAVFPKLLFSGAHTCDYLGKVVWTNPKGGDYVYIYLKVALAGNWTLFAALGLQIALLSCRMHHYFHTLKNTSRCDEAAGHRNPSREELMIDDGASSTSHEDNLDGAFLIKI